MTQTHGTRPMEKRTSSGLYEADQVTEGLVYKDLTLPLVNMRFSQVSLHIISPHSIYLSARCLRRQVQNRNISV